MSTDPITTAELEEWLALVEIANSRPQLYFDDDNNSYLSAETLALATAARDALPRLIAAQKRAGELAEKEALDSDAAL